MSLSQLEKDRLYQEEQERKRELEESLKASKEAAENVQKANESAVTVNQSAVQFERPDLVAPENIMEEGREVQRRIDQQQAQLQESLTLQQTQNQAAQHQTQQQIQQAQQQQAQQQEIQKKQWQEKQDRDQADQKKQAEEKQNQQNQQNNQQSGDQHSPSQVASKPAQEHQGQAQYNSPSMTPGYAGNTGGNVFGADNQINEKWNKHENEQASLKKEIDRKQTDISLRAARGEDVSLDSTKLEMSQNQYAINHHEHSARSFSQTAAYAKATSIAGKHDSETYEKAQGMRDHHRIQADNLKEQQNKLLERVKEQSQKQQQEQQQAQGQSQEKQQQDNDNALSPTAQARQMLNEQKTQTPDNKSPVMENNQQSSSPDNVREIKDTQASKAYDPNDRVRQAEERGQENKRQGVETGKKLTADDTKSLNEQNQKSKEIEKSHSEAKEKEQEKGKQIAR